MLCEPLKQKRKQIKIKINKWNYNSFVAQQSKSSMLAKLFFDPMLSPKNTSAPFAGIARNPTVDLTVSIDTILKIWIL
jgi:hypothetical protein